MGFKKVWDVFSYIGFCFFNLYIAMTIINYTIDMLVEVGYKINRVEFIVIGLFGLGWLSRMMKYDIEKEEINRLRRKSK